MGCEPVLRSRAAASRRMVQRIQEPPEASFETRSFEALLRMRAQGAFEQGSMPLGDLDQVAAGVVEHGEGGPLDRRRLHGEAHAEAGQTFELRLHVRDGELARRIDLGADIVAYSATKGGLDAATRSLAREMHGRFLVNSIAPGFFASEMSSVLGTEQLSTITRRTPTGQLVEPENITPTLRMLLFEDTNINGMVLTIDGGGSI